AIATLDRSIQVPRSSGYETTSQDGQAPLIQYSQPHFRVWLVRGGCLRSLLRRPSARFSFVADAVDWLSLHTGYEQPLKTGPATPGRRYIFFQTATSRRKLADRTNSRRRAAATQTQAMDFFQPCLETAACVKQYLA